MNPVEKIKENSKALRGSLEESLQDSLTGQLHEDDRHLIKFHGIYQQDNRDRRAIREQRKLEWDFSFMIRLRIPGGSMTEEQWLGTEAIADRLSKNTAIKITTRQTLQLHGIWKSRLKPTVKDFDALGLDSIAACGDVNRNVIAGVLPAQVPYHTEVHAFADALSRHLLPTTSAYREIWLDAKKITASEKPDPLYGQTYLPRKFKIAIAIPPHNETDVFAHDIGLIAIGDGQAFHGFNLVVGGGMGMTHGNPSTYPRLGTVLGFLPKEKTLEAAWQIVAIQRDNGNREDRANARLKYTLDSMGVDAFKAELQKRLGFELAPARPYTFTHRGDVYGWQKDADGRLAFTVYVEHGMVRDQGDRLTKTGLKDIIQATHCGVRLTANQNIMLYPVSPDDRQRVQRRLKKYGIDKPVASKRMQDALACVALPTCPLALAEGQRYLPTLMPKIDEILKRHGLENQPLHIRMTGCPNGCSRPYLAEVGLIGKAAGRYALRLGGDAQGERLNRLFYEELDESQILETLEALLGEYAAERQEGERFGDYIERTRPESPA